ncbi:MAG TPA: hemolysin family protein [Myxococcota bacterium]|nr:hemolysin family protein [Myxococcota bacterium]
MLYRAIPVAFCYLGAACISAIETALVGLPAARVHVAIEQKVRGAKQLMLWLRHPGRVLATLHLVRSALVIAAGLLTYLGLQEAGIETPVIGVVGGVAIISLALSHMVPRSLGKRYSLEVASRTMWLVHGLGVMLAPVVWPLAGLGRALARGLGADGEGAGPFWTPDEISRLTNDAHAQRLGERGEDLLLSIIEFSDTVIREIMVPRTEMIAMPITSSREDVHQIVLDAGHSRVPVYDETIDNIVGVLHVKDLFVSQLRGKGMQAPFDVRRLLRSTFYVPEVMKISELLREFQRRKTHMAIVVDEYGGTAGVVTLEDIIEEIVGEIQDEYDVEEKQFRVLGENKIIADGRVSIWDLEEALQVEFPSDAEYETLAGFLMSRTGSLPETGMIITWNNLRFTVKEANEKRIGMVEIERRPKTEAPTQS